MCEEEGVLWRHIQSFLVCSLKRATKGPGTRCVLVERKGEGEWAGGNVVDEGGDRQLLSLGSFSVGEHGL